jgi:hypothetical protein
VNVCYISDLLVNLIAGDSQQLGSLFSTWIEMNANGGRCRGIYTMEF